MAKLEVFENKKLVLKNVLKKELRNIKMEDLDNEIENFTKKIDLLKAQVFGPLIIKSCGTNIGEDGSITTDYDLFVQAHDYKQYKNEFIVEDSHVCQHCAYVHFEGNPMELSYAHSKLDLHFYENDLESKGEVYTVCIEDSDEYSVVDLFMPVLTV